MRLVSACFRAADPRRSILRANYSNWTKKPTSFNGGKGKDTDSPVVTLAIETSCDDTCVAVLEKTGDAAKVLFNRKATSDNRQFGGIKPTEAVQGHSSSLAGLVQEAVRHLPIDRPKPDFVSVTRGPGITSALSVGLTMAKGLAVAWERPLVAVHHMQAHALTPRLVEALANDKQPPPPPADSIPRQRGARPAFPFLSLLVSGGHTQLLLTRSAVSHATLAEAANVAIGDMLDKCARAILPAHILANTRDVMYAAELERFAFAHTQQQQQQQQRQQQQQQQQQEQQQPHNYLGYAYTAPARRRDEIRPYVSPQHDWTLTPPLHESRAMAFDFSGLGGQVQAIVQQRSADGMDDAQRAELARETMRVAFEHLASRVVFALDDMRSRAEAAALGVGGEKAAALLPVRTLVVSGGVASNRFLLHVLGRVLAARGYGHGPGEVAVVRPPGELCTDNAVMVAWAGMEMWEAGWRSELSVLPQRRWSMDDGHVGIEDPEAERVGRYKRLRERKEVLVRERREREEIERQKEEEGLGKGSEVREEAERHIGGVRSELETQREREEEKELDAQIHAEEQQVSKKSGILGLDGWVRRSPVAEILWLAGAGGSEQDREAGSDPSNEARSRREGEKVGEENAS